MSNISSVHSVETFVSGKSVPLSGQRLSKVVFKTPRKDSEETKKESKCVSIPFILDSEISANLNRLMPHIAEMLYGVQDKIIREEVLKDKTEISDTVISIKSVIEFLEAESRGDRLTKEIIEFWFEEELQDILTVAIGDKLGVSDTPSDKQVKIISQTIKAYKDSLASCAGGKTWFPAKKVEQLLKAISFTGDKENSIFCKLESRLKGMLEVKKDLEEDLVYL